MKEQQANKNIIQEKAYDFALSILDLYKRMKLQNEYVLSKQLIRSGTSIGANVEEALGGQSKKDFIAKMSIAYKEARETNYWLRLTRDTETISSDRITELIEESEQILKILSSILITSKRNP